MTDSGGPGIHRVTVEEFEAYVTASRLTQTELVNGVIFDVPPEQHLHAQARAAVYRVLTERFPDRQVLAWGSVRFDDFSLWEPDVYVLDASPSRGYMSFPDGDHVALAVEIQRDGVSHWRNYGLKFALYATRVPEYWVIEPRRGGHLRRFTDPATDGFGYNQVTNVPLPFGLDSIDSGLWDEFTKAERDTFDDS